MAIDSKGRLIVWLEVENTNILVDTHFYVIGVGHHVPDTAGKYIGTGVVKSGIVDEIILHVYEGEREFEVVKPENAKKFDDEKFGEGRLVGEPLNGEDSLEKHSRPK